MKTATVARSFVHDVALAAAAVAALDLEPIKFKIMNGGEGQYWSPEKAGAVEARYRNFLMLALLHQQTKLVPSRDIDLMWHCHILDTVKYAKDCNNVFGRYLHHYPYFGMGSEADKRDLLACFELTQNLYREHFGEAMVPAGSDAEISDCNQNPPYGTLFQPEPS